jgi:hypothetical protein
MESAEIVSSKIEDCRYVDEYGISTSCHIGDVVRYKAMFYVVMNSSSPGLRGTLRCLNWSDGKLRESMIYIGPRRLELFVRSKDLHKDKRQLTVRSEGYQYLIATYFGETYTCGVGSSI